MNGAVVSSRFERIVALVVSRTGVARINSHYGIKAIARVHPHPTGLFISRHTMNH
jgi:hypothetical protein